VGHLEPPTDRKKKNRVATEKGFSNSLTFP